MIERVWARVRLAKRIPRDVARMMSAPPAVARLLEGRQLMTARAAPVRPSASAEVAATAVHGGDDIFVNGKGRATDRAPAIDAGRRARVRRTGLDRDAGVAITRPADIWTPNRQSCP